MAALFVGVDWGTSNARFMLVDADGSVMATRNGPGIAQLAGAAAIADAVFDAVTDWPPVPVIMAGMVGSNIGWHLAPYAATPATVADTATGAVRFAARGRSFALLPGVETVRADGFPDVMRGEETQIFGALGQSSGLACLPGTHSKWVVVNDGTITQFHTAMTGELLDLIGRHSIVLNPKRPPLAVPDQHFLDAVTTMKASALGLETMVFTVRSRQIAGTLSADAAAHVLVGLCIGADIRSALLLYPDARSITLIGTPALTALYASGLAIFGIPSRQIDGCDAALAGLTHAYQAVFA
jgi:2-dehydro-3-deoxygalactonokinase